MNKMYSALLIMLFSLYGSTFWAGHKFSKDKKSTSDTMDVVENMEIVDDNEVGKIFEYFPNLPVELQNHILKYMWVAHDSKDQFKQRLVEWGHTNFVEGYITSRSEREKYGFSGYKIPIHFYTLKDDKPTTIEAGVILQDAQPAILSGVSHLDTEPQNLMFLCKPQKGLCHEIVSQSNFDVYGAALSVHGDIAIAWAKHNDFFVTFLRLKDLKDNLIVNLDKNKMALDNIAGDIVNVDNTKFDSNLQIKNILFNLQGSLLAISWYDDPKTTATSVKSAKENKPTVAIQFIKNPSGKTELSIEEIGKRLAIKKVGEKFKKEDLSKGITADVKALNFNGKQ